MGWDVSFRFDNGRCHENGRPSVWYLSLLSHLLRHSMSIPRAFVHPTDLRMSAMSITLHALALRVCLLQHLLRSRPRVEAQAVYGGGEAMLSDVVIRVYVDRQHRKSWQVYIVFWRDFAQMFCGTKALKSVVGVSELAGLPGSGLKVHCGLWFLVDS